ncbi:MAG: ATP-dependent sacrificial sulfur transferase LarE [Terrimicrobiaceae bacterium]
MTLEEKIRKVEEIVRAHAPILIAYSGGVDSACLLALASRAVGDRMLGAIADSPSLPRSALKEALTLAENIGAPVEIVATSEFENEEYLANPTNRCYFCKAELFTCLESMARDRGYRSIAYGENADDRSDLRPGSKAAAEFQVLAPLKAAGLSKAEVREISRGLGLPTHDAPSQPCLSSRIPHGTRVSSEALSLVEKGEEFVRSLGFKVFRVRYLEGPPTCAKLQVAPAEMGLLAERRSEIEDGLKSAGFDAVEIDPDGYRGS